MLTAVYGPVSTAAWKEDPEKAIVEVTFKLASNPAGMPYCICVHVISLNVPF